MVSILPLISNCPNLFSNHLGTIQSARSRNDNIFTRMFHTLLSSLARSKYLYIFSLFFLFTLCSTETVTSSWQQSLLFFRHVNSSGRHSVIHMHLKIPENFMCFIFQNGFWFVYLPFDSMVKSFVQSPLSPLFHSVMRCLVLLYSFAQSAGAVEYTGCFSAEG